MDTLEKKNTVMECGRLPHRDPFRGVTHWCCGLAVTRYSVCVCECACTMAVALEQQEQRGLAGRRHSGLPAALECNFAELLR